MIDLRVIFFKTKIFTKYITIFNLLTPLVFSMVDVIRNQDIYLVQTLGNNTYPEFKGKMHIIYFQSNFCWQGQQLLCTFLQMQHKNLCSNSHTYLIIHHKNHWSNSHIVFYKYIYKIYNHLQPPDAAGFFHGGRDS